MPTRWMRWNETTHVFENSVDGVTFNPLPLNASCLEGTVPPATLPGGGGGASGTGNNTWTGSNTYSGVAPAISFNETDGAANAKNWDVGIDTGLFRVRTLNDALAAAATLFSIDRNGNLSVSAVAVGTHNFNANVDGPNYLHPINTNAGVSAAAGMMMQNNVGDARGYVVFTSNANTNAAFAADALSLYSAGVGGISINAGGAAPGPITFKTANTVRMTIAASGAVTIPGAVTFNGVTDFNAAITADQITSSVDIFAVNFRASAAVVAQAAVYSYGLPMGLWTPVTWAAALFTASGGVWTVEAADMSTYAYTIIGKTMIVSVDINNSSQSITAAELRIALPAGVVVTRGMTTIGWSTGSANDANSFNIFVYVAAGVSYIAMRPISASTGAGANFVASANVLDIKFQIAFQIN